MKQIQPVQIWYNGQLLSAIWLQAYIINDNLQDSATFYWALFSGSVNPDQQDQQLAQGNLTIVDPEYDQWGQSGDINQAAYEWIAGQLGLTLV